MRNSLIVAPEDKSLDAPSPWVAAEASLKGLREKHSGKPRRERPFFIDERSWAVFTAYVYESRTLRDMQKRRRIPASRMRQILYDVDARLDLPERGELEWKGITPQSPIEDLELSIRARNTLHKVGCRSIQEVMHLDLSGPRPRVGAKTRTEVLVALQRAGFRHPALERSAAVGLTALTRSLDRMQQRIDVALRSVSKEVSLVQRQLQAWLQE